MCYHEQAAVHAGKVLLQPLYHLEVEVVRRLIKNHQFGLLNQYCSKCNTFLLTARQLLYRLVEISDFQFAQHLFRTVFIVPCIKTVHLLHEVLQL